MTPLLPYLKKMHHVVGFKLYVNFFSMMIISSLEGAAIYLLIPMLGVIGVLSVDVGPIPLIAWMNQGFARIPEYLQLLVILLSFIVIVTIQAFLQRSQTIQNSKIQQMFIKSLRFETYRAILQSNWSLFVKKRRADFTHMMTHEIANVSQGTVSALGLGTNLVFTGIQIVFALWLSVKLTLFVLVSGILLALFSRKFIRKAKHLGENITLLARTYTAGVTEHFNGIKDIKSNTLEEHHYTWFTRLGNKMEDTYVQFSRLQTTSQLVYRVVSTLLIAMFIWVSIKLLRAEPGQLMLVILIFTRLWPRFTSIQSSWQQIVSTFPAFESLSGLHRECADAKELDIDRHGQAVTAMRMEQNIECRHLFYRYDLQEPVYALHDVSFQIVANSMTAVVGKSGAGKSTLIDLLIGLIVPERGEIRIDGIPLTPANRPSIRGAISYVSQDPFLFHATVRENLMMVVPGATEEEMWEALRFSASDEFISKLPQGLDTVIGDRGIKLSGGERQRLVLARAILRKPLILVLDEATSALDHENEIKIQEALDRLKGKMTLIVIAHRLSTIRNADQVIVLENGRVIQQGEYQKLSDETRGTFSKMLASG